MTKNKHDIGYLHCYPCYLIRIDARKKQLWTRKTGTRRQTTVRLKSLLKDRRLSIHAANRLGDQYYLVKQACDEYVTNHGKDTLSKQQLDYILGRFNVILPEVAFEKFWETIASSGEAEVSVSQFLQKLKPKQPPNVRAAGLRAKDMPSAFASSPKKPKKLFNWNPAELGPIPIWDNEWRQVRQNEEATGLIGR
eukprot:765032-Hanusia_phi.AAC.1